MLPQAIPPRRKRTFGPAPTVTLADDALPPYLRDAFSHLCGGA
jgi:hypothetical protein